MTQTASGRKAWTLSAPLASVGMEGAAFLRDPTIQFYKDGRPASTARAREASIPAGSKDVLLSGDVVILSPQEKATLKTQRLEYNHMAARFHTEEPVVLERPGAVLRGRGLSADATLSEIRIRHQESSFR